MPLPNHSQRKPQFPRRCGCSITEFQAPLSEVGHGRLSQKMPETFRKPRARYAATPDPERSRNVPDPDEAVRVLCRQRSRVCPLATPSGWRAASPRSSVVPLRREPRTASLLRGCYPQTVPSPDQSRPGWSVRSTSAMVRSQHGLLGGAVNRPETPH